MNKKTLLVRRLSSFSILKLILIGGIGSMAALNILFIGFHLVTLDFIVNYQETIGETSAPQETSLFVYTLFSFPALILIGGFQALFIWPFSTLGLWCWSKVRPLELEYYEDHGKEI